MTSPLLAVNADVPQILMALNAGSVHPNGVPFSPREFFITSGILADSWKFDHDTGCWILPRSAMPGVLDSTWSICYNISISQWVLANEGTFRRFFRGREGNVEECTSEEQARLMDKASAETTVNVDSTQKHTKRRRRKNGQLLSGLRIPSLPEQVFAFTDALVTTIGLGMSWCNPCL